MARRKRCALKAPKLINNQCVYIFLNLCSLTAIYDLGFFLLYVSGLIHIFIFLIITECFCNLVIILFLHTLSTKFVLKVGLKQNFSCFYIFKILEKYFNNRIFVTCNRIIVYLRKKRVNFCEVLFFFLVLLLLYCFF